MNIVEHYFKRISETEWIETKDGIYFARFNFVEQKDDYVVIYKVDGKFNITLSSNYATHIKLFGKWIV